MSDAVESQEVESQAPVEGEQPVNGERQEPETDEFKSEESKQAVLADLKAERDRRKALQSQVEQFEQERVDAEKANMSELGRAQAELQEVRESAEKANTELMRYRVAGDHKITDKDDIELFLTGSDEETLARQAQRLAERNIAPNNPKPDLTQGASGKHTPPSNAEQFASQLGDF